VAGSRQGRLPDFIGIGAQKAGTTLLYELLARHPQVCLARHRKEVHYFDRYYERGPEWYASLFEHCSGRRAGEITPAYVYGPQCARRISELVPQVRLLLIIRNPIDRAYSHYKFKIREKEYRGSFAEFLVYQADAISRGFYSRQLARYLDFFPREQLLLLVFEQFIEDMDRTWRQVCRFMDITPDHVKMGPVHVPNRSELPRMPGSYSRIKRFGSLLRDHDLDWVIHGVKALGLRRLFFPRTARTSFPPMTAEDRTRLRETYGEDVAQLERLTGLDLRRTWDFETTVPAKT